MNEIVRNLEPAAGSLPAAISIRGLGKHFTPGKPVFSDITFDVASGSIVALLGSNGAGKSTLLRCIPRLIEPNAGSVEINGDPVSGSKALLRKQRAKLGFVFQKHNLVGRLSALTNVIHGAQSIGYGFRAWSQAIAPQALRIEGMAALARVALSHLAMQRADSLSGGQSQRVAIARALMQRPSIVLADEPAASLDPQAGEEVMQLFSDLMRQEKKTVLFTSHNIDHAMTYADRIIALGEGRILIDAPSRALKASDLRGIYG